MGTNRNSLIKGDIDEQRKHYNDNIVKQIRKFEKLDYKIRRNEVDLEFLTSCQQNKLTPKF